MDRILAVNKIINSFIWGPVMLILLVGTGIFLTFKLKGFTLRKLGYVFRNTLLQIFKKDHVGEGEITPFQAVATALAATVGTGNIVGVSMAIATGGPGAIFWMWLSALFGMATKFAEVVLSIEYREKTEDGRFVGGPMYYIRNGLNNNVLAMIFAIFGAIAAFGIGNLVQSNSMSESLFTTFGVSTTISGIVLCGLTILILFGGLKRISSIAEKLVPVMAVFYILGGLLIIILNIKMLPATIALIFKSALTPKAAQGGFLGATVAQAMKMGMARGIFSNEAGLGSAPIAHAAARTDHPVRQGLWGIFEVFADTIVICSITAFCILMTGVWDSGETGVVLATSAFNEGLYGYGGYIVSIGILLFAFTTQLGWSYYGEKCAEFIFGEKAILPYRIIWIPVIFIGATGGLEVLWDIADTFNGLMAIPNLIGVLGLSGVVIRLTKEFLKQEKIDDVKIN